MARLLVMTCSVSSVTATQGVAGECLFTLTNLVSEPLQAQVRIMPLDGPVQGWFTLPGGEHLDLGAGQTRQVVVQITPASVGRSIFRLDATPTQPVGERTIGPSVIVEVASNPIPQHIKRPGMPWWVPLLAGGLALMVGGVIWLLMAGRGEHEADSSGSETTPTSGAANDAATSVEPGHAGAREPAGRETTGREKPGTRETAAASTVTEAASHESLGKRDVSRSDAALPARTAERPSVQTAERPSERTSVKPLENAGESLADKSGTRLEHRDSDAAQATVAQRTGPASELADAPQVTSLARFWFAAMRAAEIDALVAMSPPPFLFDHASAATALEVRKHYQSFTTPQARAIFAKLTLTGVAVTRADEPAMAAEIRKTGLSGVDVVASLTLHAGDEQETFTLYLRRSPTLHLAGMSR